MCQQTRSLHALARARPAHTHEHTKGGACPLGLMLMMRARGRANTTLYTCGAELVRAASGYRCRKRQVSVLHLPASERAMARVCSSASSVHVRGPGCLPNEPVGDLKGRAHGVVGTTARAGGAAAFSLLHASQLLSKENVKRALSLDDM